MLNVHGWQVNANILVLTGKTTTLWYSCIIQHCHEMLCLCHILSYMHEFFVL